MNPKAVLILSLIALLLGLNKACDSGPEFLPGIEGNMVGYLYSFDEYGILLDDHSGFWITALGHAGSYKAYSNSEGRFELRDLPTGTYELNFWKPGFGTLRQFGVQHLGGKATILLLRNTYLTNDQIKAYFLYEVSKTQIQDLHVENDTITATFLFHNEALPEWASIYLYFSNEEGFDIQEAQFTLPLKLREEEGFYIEPMDFEEHPFESGERIYYRAAYFTRPWEWQQQDIYLYELYGPDSYLDYESNQIIFPNRGEVSEQFSFVLQD